METRAKAKKNDMGDGDTRETEGQIVEVMIEGQDGQESDGSNEECEKLGNISHRITAGNFDQNK